MIRNRLLLIQATLVFACALFFGLRSGTGAFVASLYGGGLALISAWLLLLRVRKAGELAETSPKQSVYSLYFGAVQRFVLVLVALAVGMGALKLQPIPLLVSFGLAQLAYALGVGKPAATPQH